jgi:hypothetical protein
MTRRLHFQPLPPRVEALEAHRCACHGERRRKAREAIAATTAALRAELSPWELRRQWAEENANG